LRESSRGVFTPPNGFLLLLFELFLVFLGWATVSPRLNPSRVA
jgi:hypothetical protein